MKKLVGSVLILSLIAVTPAAFAGTSAGDKEVGVSGSIRFSEDSTGVSANASTNWFFTDAFSLGVGLFSMMTMPDNGDDMIMNMVFVEPNYHFAPEAEVVPYAGVHVGLGSFESGDYSSTSITYGAQGGVKKFVSENVALKGECRYTDMDGNKELGLHVGMSLFF